MQRLKEAVNLAGITNGLKGDGPLARFSLAVTEWYEALRGGERFTEAMRFEVQKLLPLLKSNIMQVFVECVPKVSADDRKALPRGAEELHELLESVPGSPYEDLSGPPPPITSSFPTLPTTSAKLQSRGLPNHWNTCYMNTTIQLLFHVPGLVDKLREHSRNESLLETARSPTRCIEKFLVALGDQDDAMIDRYSRAYFTSLEDLATAGDSWAKFYPKPSEEGHQDVCEYLEQLMSDKDSGLAVVYQDLLGYNCVNKVQCLACGEEHAQPPDPNATIDVGFDEPTLGQTLHLQDIISEDMDELVVLEEAACEVPGCGGVGKLRQRVLHADKVKPRACLVWLKRGSRAGRHNDAPVEFDERPFHLTCIREANQPANVQCFHQLHAVVHFVSGGDRALTGHYYIDVRGADGSWTRFEDHKVNPVSFAEVKVSTATAFLLVPYPAVHLAPQAPIHHTPDQDPATFDINRYIDQFLAIDHQAIAHLLPTILNRPSVATESLLVTATRLTLPDGAVHPIHLTTGLDHLLQETGRVATRAYQHALAGYREGEHQGPVWEDYLRIVINRLKQADFVSRCRDIAMSQALSLNVLAFDNYRKFASELWRATRRPAAAGVSSLSYSEGISRVVEQMNGFILQKNGIIPADELDQLCSKLRTELQDLYQHR